MSPAECELASEKLRAGIDLITAIIEAVFKLWPHPCLTIGSCGTHGSPHCVNCAKWNTEAPEVQALNKFRAAVGTRRLGSFRPQVKDAESGEDAEGGWAASHTVEDAVQVLQSLAPKETTT